MHDITGSTVSIKAAAPANTSFRQCSYRPSTLLAAWWALLQFCRYAGFLLPYLHQAVQGGAADERWAQEREREFTDCEALFHTEKY